MEARLANRTRRVGPPAWLAVMLLAQGAAARAQAPGLPGVAPPDRALLPSPSPPVGASVVDDAELVDAVESLGAMTWPTTVPRPWYGTAWDTARVETGIFETAARSIFGRPDPGSWRPLPFSTFFSEGWNEPWVPSPRGSGGAPRQGWINAVAGNFYRLSFFTFSQGFNEPPRSNAYLGSYTLMTPLSRRLMLITNVPFVLRNSTESGLPIINPPGQTVPTSRSHTGFGDLSFTPRVLLHQTRDFSLTAELAIPTATGNRPLAGKAALTPAVGFWANFEGGWVIRGGVGDLIPLGGGGSDALISQLAIGQTLTDHDTPLFGDFTYYLSAVVNTPLRDGQRTSVTLTPGLCTHLGRDRYLLAGLPTPLTEARVADLGMILWFVKSW
jgi:hypothetical protein